MRGRGDGEANGEGESDRREAKRRVKSGWKKKRKTVQVLMRGKVENRRRQEMMAS